MKKYLFNEYPVACHGHLVGKYENPRFSSNGNFFQNSLFVEKYPVGLLRGYLLTLTILLAGILAPILVIRAAAPDFALVAVGPNGQRAVCVRQPENSVLSALSSQGFQPKLDDTGFVYSLIGYDGPLSSDPAVQQAFWGFWIGNDHSFSSFGPSQVKPENDQLYLLYFGDGAKPTINISYADICNTESPTPLAEQSPVAVSQSDLALSHEYLRNNYQGQSLSNKDWAAMALGGYNQSIKVETSSQESVLSLSRNALALAGQNQDRSAIINKIKANYRANQFGDPNLINDDIFAILAVQSTDPSWLEDRPLVFDTIISSQRSNGSFGFSRNSEGDTDLTAAAIWALAYQPNYPTDPINKAISYLATAQNNDGGFGFRSNQPSNVASSSWVVLAYRAVNKSTASGESYLINKKQSAGYWLFGSEPNYLNTAYAVLALSGKKMPIIGYSAETVNPVPIPAKLPQSQKIRDEVFIETYELITEESYSDSSSCSASASAFASTSDLNAHASASATSTNCN